MYDNVDQDPSIPQRIRDKLLNIAYTRQHHNGEDAVNSMYTSMLADFEDIINDIKLCGNQVDSQISLLKPLVDSLDNKESLTEGESMLIIVWDTTQYITSHLTGDTHT